jgi:hypothetical protein
MAMFIPKYLRRLHASRSIGIISKCGTSYEKIIDVK